MNRTLWEEFMIQESGWIGILSAHPKFEANEDFVSLVEQRFSDVDLETEAVRCLEWLTSTAKGRRRTKIRSTFLNWLKNTRRFASSPTKRYNRYTDPSVPARSPGGVY
jgi:hypothetical protein